MKGVQYVVDEKGTRSAVLIDLKEHGELWEDFEVLVVARSRRHEPRESSEEIEARLRRVPCSHAEGGVSMLTSASADERMASHQDCCHLARTE